MPDEAPVTRAMDLSIFIEIPFSGSSGCERRPQPRRFLDRDVAERGADRQHDVHVPEPVVAPGALVHLAAKPGAEEAADLVEQHDDAEERRDVANAVELADETNGGRDGREVGDAQ